MLFSMRCSLVLVVLLLLGLPWFPCFLPAAFSQTAQQIEAQTIQQGIALRQPEEADTIFLKRILPVSFPTSGDLVVYPWRLNTYGKQLFFTVKGGADNEYGYDLFVLDPIQANTYAVQILSLGSSMGDMTYLTSLFFADVDEDGQKELLTLLECSLREEFKVDGQWLIGRKTHYQTRIFKYMMPSSTGRPQYQEDTTPRPYLDELATAAEVRQNLPKRKSTQRKPDAKVPK
ncbi:hypothetical protein HER32_01280 [Hymenobacter sp. BT18]|uniref:hypothetical protein n=1 Tax=Hymenobacter sp. BT18 TaxID=2835648 RepID=UPI00143E1A40|nr:hypothetical protein [Hymenobacter sp. BT18]QIX59895.1 hypothetical protein HER32_01280 [Hymenobacter sp. BT18]